MLAALSLVCLAFPQDPESLIEEIKKGNTTQGTTRSGLSRQFVDFHEDLDHRGFVAVVGTLDKTKDGRRRRMPEGKMVRGGSTITVSGAQYFEVPVKASIKAQSVLAGKAGSKVRFDVKVQLVRLPSGEERRQTMSSKPQEFAPGMLGLWILAAPAKGRGLELRHVIPFDAKADESINDEGKFADAMADFVTINQRLAELQQGLASFDAAVDVADRARCRAQLEELLAEEIELRRPELDGLLADRTGPWTGRIKKRLEATPDAGSGPGKDG
ncbi:MAG: hypothetical protein VYE77_03685 [Planctomycetota bacterium]|nr:hypothetical protein [Planctomycetota bacterium]